MAQLKDSVVAGSLRVTDTIYGVTAQLSAIKIPTASGGNTLGSGTNGQIIMTNGTDVYWSSTATPSAHNHAAGDITSGTLAIARGGTNASTTQGAKANLGLGTSAMDFGMGTFQGATQHWGIYAIVQESNIENTHKVFVGKNTALITKDNGLYMYNLTDGKSIWQVEMSTSNIVATLYQTPEESSPGASKASYKIVYKGNDSTAVGGLSTPVYVTANGEITAGTAIGAAGYKGVINNTSTGALGWTSSNGAGNVPTINTIAYWNGAYSGTNSNLQYLDAVVNTRIADTSNIIVNGKSSHLYLQETHIIKGTNPSTQYWSAIEFHSADTTQSRLGLIEHTVDTSGNSQLNIFVVPNVSGSTSWSGIILKKDTSNNLTISLQGPTTVTSGTLTVGGGVVTPAITTSDGSGLLAYKPTGWNGISDTQWGIGTINASGVIRSSDNNLIHYRAGTNYAILDTYNYLNWAKNNTAVGALGWTDTTSDKVIITSNTLAFWNGAYSGTTSNLSKLGTVTNGTWQATPISLQYINNWAFVGRNAEITANKNWYKVASCSISDVNQDREMVLHVYDTMVTGAARSGILNVRVRTGSPLTSTTPALNLVWEYNNGFTSDQFKLVSNANTSPCVAELWTNVPYNWIGRVFTVIRMGTRIEGQTDAWTLYKNYSVNDNGATGSTSSLTNSVTASYLDFYTGTISATYKMPAGGITYGIPFKNNDGNLAIASNLYWQDGGWVLLNKYATGGVTIGYYAEGSIHRIGFSIGSSNTYRGIWDANGVGGWTYQLDADSNVYINAGKASNEYSIITLNPNNSSTNYGVQINGYCAVKLNIYSGTITDTVERQTGARSKAGKICVYASGSATGDCGLYWWNNANTGRYIIQTAQDGTARFYGKSDYVRDVTNSGTIDFDYMKSGGYSATPWACMWVNSSNNGNAGMRVGAVSIGNLRNKLLTNGNQADQMWSWGGLTTNSANTAYVNKEFYLVTTTHGLFLWNQSDGNTTWNIPNVIYNSTQPTVVNGAVWLKPV